MKVSVIVPVYKAEKWLHRCVDSILAQTMTDFELLFVDDGSQIVVVRFVMSMQRKIHVYEYFIKRMEGCRRRVI